MKERRILLLSTNADLAGAPLHVKQLALALRGVGWEVIMVFGEQGEIETELRDQGFETHVIGTLRSNLNIVDDFRSFLALRTIVRKTKPRLIHAHSSKAGMIGRLVAFAEKLPVIYTVHGWGFGTGRKKIRSHIVKLVEFFLRNFTSHFITVSEFDRQAGIHELGLDPASVTTIHNGIDESAYRANPFQSKVVVMVARHEPQKDYRTLLSAVDGLGCELWCIGRDTDSEEFRRTAAILCPGDFHRIRFLGTQKNVPELISKCGIFVLSTRFEGLPLSIIEAMRSGLPVVATDVGGVSELITDRFNGILVPMGDVRTLRSSIQSLLIDGRKRHIMGHAGQARYLASFSSPQMLSRTLKVYETCLAVS